MEPCHEKNATLIFQKQLDTCSREKKGIYYVTLLHLGNNGLMGIMQLAICLKYGLLQTSKEKGESLNKDAAILNLTNVLANNKQPQSRRNKNFRG